MSFPCDVYLDQRTIPAMAASLEVGPPTPDDAGLRTLSPLPPDGPCANCGATRTGPFCRQCGQERVAERLTLGGLTGHLAHAFDLERGILGTAVELFRLPHHVIGGFLRGKTVPYTNPFKHFLLALSVVQALSLITGTTGEVASGFAAGRDVEVAASEVVQVLDRYFVLLAAPSVLVLAAVQRLLFRRAQWTFAEHLASVLFIAGNELLLWIPAFFTAGAKKSLAGNVLVSLILVAALAYYVWGARGLFARSVPGTVPRAIATIGVSALVSIVLFALMLNALVS